MVLAGIVSLAVVLLLTARFLTRDWMCVAVFGGFPLLMIALSGRLELQVFTWVKVMTLCAGMFLVQFGPRSGAALRNPVRVAAYVLLVVNIFEAAVYDVVAQRWLGAAAAAALILLTPRWNAVSFVSESNRQVVAFDLSWPWIMGYTFWNAAFVTTTYPEIASDHIAVLSVPLLLALASGDRKAWLRHRAITLAMYGILAVAAREIAKVGWIPSIPGAESLRNPLLAASLAMIACDALLRMRSRAPQPDLV